MIDDFLPYYYSYLEPFTVRDYLALAGKLVLYSPLMALIILVIVLDVGIGYIFD